MRQPLRGLVGQDMSGRKKALTPIQRSYPPGTHTFTVTEPGVYRFVMWGAGGGGNLTSAGGSGAFILAERSLAAGQSVAITVGGNVRTGTTSGANGGNTTVTLPSGLTLTAGGGTAGTAGATGGAAGSPSGYDAARGDVALSGSQGGNENAAGPSGAGTDGGAGGAAGGTRGGGAGAPGSMGYRGGDGSAGASRTVPGVGAGAGALGGSEDNPGGTGLVIVTQVKMRR